MPSSQDWLDVIDPSTGEIYGQLPNSNREDVQQAYEAAQKAFPEWSKTSVEKRSTILAKIADLIEDNLEVLAKAESMDNGKPLSLAKTWIITAAEALVYYRRVTTGFNVLFRQYAPNIRLRHF